MTEVPITLRELNEKTLGDWLASLPGVDAPVSQDELPDADPANVHAVSIYGGLGLTMEQGFDRPTFQVMTRGRTGAEASRLANALDRAIIGAETPFDLAGLHVVDRGRVGGPPSRVARDDKRRVVRAARYWLEVEFPK